MLTEKNINQSKIPELKDEIFEHDNRLVIRSYSLSRDTEKYLREFVRMAMEGLDRPDLVPVIEIIAKELVTNATKANFKKIYFAENHLKLDNPQEYSEGVSRFRESLSEEGFRKYGDKAKDAQLMVLTTFDYDDDRIILEIRNNVPMTEEEEKRAREKLRIAMQSSDMEKFIAENADETEGAGLGIMLCLTTLRSSDFDPRLFSIASDLRTHTVARLELPLHQGYKPTRERYAERASRGGAPLGG
ncbi:MAG: hypothetical protein LDLANPLL_01466 [Turneriella sp.]|nr:hypothetical protein [Turneriella sp.]